MFSAGTISTKQSILPFVFSALALSFAAAGIACCAPIAFSIATVFLFAGPHNWVELRYFLSRLPARFGQLKPYFAWSFAGLAFLMATYLALILATNVGILNGTARSITFSAWNTLLIVWVIRLVLLAGERRTGRDWGLAVPAGLFVISGAWLAPAFFWLFLVYAHPFVGLCILDREISRSRPDLQKAYRLCLGVVPLMLAIIWLQLINSPPLVENDLLSWQITQHAGASILTGCSSHLLVSTHTFLEVIHYGVWLLAIPFVSAGWRSWQPCSLPLTLRSYRWKRLVSFILPISSLAVISLWLAFGFNFTTTRDIYFTLALAHVLAEIPFLLKALM